MPARTKLPYNAVSRDSENGGRWKTGGGSTQTVYGDTSGSVVTNASLVVADLVDVVGVAVDGTATAVDNVALVGGEIVLRTAGVGLGGQVDNGLWEVPSPPISAWRRYRQDLHTDGLPVFVRDGAASARGAVAPLVDFGGYRDTLWKLTTDVFTLGTDPIEFRQLPTHDGLKLRYTLGGPILIPGVGTWRVPFDTVGQAGAFTTDLGGLYLTETLGVGANVTATYSGLYRVGVSIFGSRTTGAGPIAAEVHIGPAGGAVALYQTVIHHNMTTVDERYYGETLVRLAGDDLEQIQIHISDPAGAGFTYTAADIYVDITTVTRR